MSLEIRSSAYQATSSGNTSRLYFETTTYQGRPFYLLRNQNPFTPPLCVRNFFRGLVKLPNHFSWTDFSRCLEDKEKYSSIVNKVQEFLLHPDFRLFRKILKLRDEGKRASANWLQLRAKIGLLTKGSSLARSQGFDPRILMQLYHREAVTDGVWYLEVADTRPWKLKYLSTPQRTKYEVQIIQGKLTKNGKPHTTRRFCGCLRTSQIFVLAPDRKLYMAKFKYDKLHHSSFLSGAAVLSAGEIETDADGTIVKVTNSSGHYLPDKPQTITLLKVLQEQGCDLSSIRIEEVTQDGRQNFPNALHYLEQAEKLLAP